MVCLLAGSTQQLGCAQEFGTGSAALAQDEEAAGGEPRSDQSVVSG